MHLRSVTLRGFKSFADRTQIELDPGLVAVVGPNGAGKSNLVDALVWALGTLSTRALRLERMEDLIFTGTVQRKQLGMAQVLLTFDNTGGIFPVDFTEVEVGRTLYRDGASEYTLNGTTCRLLDIHELMSEAGIGRELHAVVAQGEVDDIVQSRPEELRSYVEEAAGISKHRRRKERALRKIEGVEQDIARVVDLLGELRRQIRPLRAQADAALRHREVTTSLRELQIRLAVAELTTLGAERRRAVEFRETAGTQLEGLRDRLRSLREAKAMGERRLDEARREAAAMRRSLERLRSAQAQALRAVIVLRERARAAPDTRRREEVAAKLAELDRLEGEVRAELDGVAGRIAERQERLGDLRDRAREARQEATTRAGELAAVRDELREVDVESRAAERQVISSRAEAAGASERYDKASDRIARLSQQSDGIRQEIERLDSDGGRTGLTVERLEAERREAATGFEEADSKLRGIESEAAVLAGRLESLRVARDLAASRRRGAETLRARHGVELGARGVLGDVVRVPAEFEAAVESAMGQALDALIVAGVHLAEAVERAEACEADVLLAPTLPTHPGEASIPGARRLAEVIDCPGWLRGTVDALLARTYLVDAWEEARDLSGRHPWAVFVTPSGRVLSAQATSRPARAANPTLGIGPALEQTQEAVKRVDAERSRWNTNRDRRRRDLERLDGELEEARSALHELEGRIAAAADRLRELKAEEHAATLERDLAARDRDDRLRTAEEAAARGTELGRRDAELRAHDEQLAVRAAEAEERAVALDAEARGLEEGLTELLTTRASLDERVRGIEATRADLRAEAARAVEPPTDPGDLEAAEAMLASLDATVAKTEARGRELMDREESVEDELRRAAEDASRAEVEAAALEPRTLGAAETVARLDARIEDVGTRLARDHEIPPSRAKEEFPPPSDTKAAEREAARLEAEVKRMGPVNPLAAEEVVALEERRQFLEAQIEDLRRSKRGLMKLVRAAEERMRELLVVAVQDADVRFREVVGLLFPEGDGRLRLAGAEDPLEAGLEIEVRLGRKGHRRLGFLSGGEKALAGLAFLFALHLARPTPFLVLDEVDAPLDDANLGRFIRLLDALRTKTQVLVITHQKRTMERADTLVGVTLNPDGTSRVVTQNIHEHVQSHA